MSSPIPVEVLNDPAIPIIRAKYPDLAKQTPHQKPDPEGFKYYGCRECNNLSHEIQVNEDGETLRLTCLGCGRQIQFKIIPDTLEALTP